MATTIKTFTGNDVDKFITELSIPGKYPLLDNAERYTPAFKEEPITRIDLCTYGGESLDATREDGGYVLKAYTKQSDVAWNLLRVKWPLTATDMKNTSEEAFWRQNGADAAINLLNNAIECQGVASVQAAVTASLIQNETAHIVGGANTTFDSMTDAQLIAYLNHIYLTLKALNVPVLPDRMVFAPGHIGRFLTLLNGVSITTSGGAISIDTTTKVYPEVKALLETGLEEDNALTYSGYMGARTGASPWSTAAFMYSSKASNQTMRFSLWNQVMGPGKVSGTHSEHMILESNEYLSLIREKGCFYITAAWS
jgi:hypothetical protein